MSGVRRRAVAKTPETLPPPFVPLPPQVEEPWSDGTFWSDGTGWVES